MQRRRLIRTRTLAAFRHALVDLAHEGAPLDARRRAIVVPTGAAAELLRQTMESRLRGGARAWPDLVTRAELIDRLAGAVAGWPRLLARTEREVLMLEAARRVAKRPRMQGAPFPLRPGLVAAMLDFYDELRRRMGSVRRLVHALFDQLETVQGMDRGSESLIHQTSFLGFTYLAYERAARATGAQDEHVLRDRLLSDQPRLPIDHLIVAVADHPLDPRGLWPSDFDLLGRLRHLARLDVVVTDNVHDAGFRERVENELPGIEEHRIEEPSPGGATLLRPAGDEDAICFVSRDREDELRAVANDVRAGATRGVLRDRHAVVFQRPLPYLYLAAQVLTDARVPYQAFDAVPLASEPYAAALDVVVTAARTAGTRDAAVALLRSRLLRHEVSGEDVTPADASALDRVLTERRAVADATTFPAEVEAYFRGAGQRRLDLKPPALRAALAAAAAAKELAPFRTPGPMSGRVRAIANYLRRHESPSPGPDVTDSIGSLRQHRARLTVLGTLDELADALDQYAPDPSEDDDPTAAVRHAIESRLFTPSRGGEGIHLVDAVAARFGEFDHVHLVGLVETDWPERTRRNLFYATDLLKPLGFPGQREQAKADRATFADLLTLPFGTLRLSAFQREGDAIVGLSPMVEVAREMPTRVAELKANTALEKPALSEVEGWLTARRGRGALTEVRFGGSVGPQTPVRYRVSRVDHYVDCPFRYFAENVLGLPEEREEAAGLTPLERGTLIHKLFEDFFRSWMADPGGAITAEQLPAALARFAQLTEATLASLPEADRALERTRLLGSLVAPGIADRVFEIEVDAGQPVVRRMLEEDLKGTFTFPQLGGLKQRAVEIHGKADRIDVLGDGSIRVIDYKLSRLPDTKTSIQIAVYAHAARQKLEESDRRSYTIRDAMYLAFGDEDKFSGPLGNRDHRTEDVVHARVQVFADIIDRIEAGEFPAMPRKVSDCSWCRYAGVCRKEYRTETDEAAEPV